MPAPNTGADQFRFPDPHMDAAGTLAGVRIVRASMSNGPGQARLRAAGLDGKYLQWRAPGSATWGLPVDCGSDGEQMLEDGEDRNRYAVIDITAARLEPGETVVQLADPYNHALQPLDVTALQASAGGDVGAHLVNITNFGTAPIVDPRLWIASTPGTMWVRAPGGTYVQPTSEQHADVIVWAVPPAIKTVAAGGFIQVQIKQVIPMGMGADPGIMRHLRIGFTA